MSEFSMGNNEEEQYCYDAEFYRAIAANRATQRLDEVSYLSERPNHTPVGLDPLSTARHYEMIASFYGPESQEAQETYQVLRNDVRTALFEALIERGHISTTHSSWDEGHQGFRVGTMLYRDVLERAFDGRLIVAEHERRQVEYHEELFIEELYKSGLLSGRALLTISPYPDDIPTSWARDLGYKPSTKKYMMRWVEVENGVRTTKQISMSGSDTKVLSQFLREQGYIEGEDLSATEVLNTPVLIESGQFTHISQVAQAIDTISGPDVFLGGKQNGDSYETLETVSLEREARLAQLIDSMAAELIEIERATARGKVPIHMQVDAYGYVLLKTRNAICKIDPEMARESIGEKAYNKYKEAQAMIARGESEIDVDMCIAEAERDSEEVYVCGMSVNANGEPEGKPCVEIKNGQIVKCPGCKHTVPVRVEGPKKDKLYCPRTVCKLSKAGGKAKSTKVQVKKQDKQLVGA